MILCDWLNWSVKFSVTVAAVHCICYGALQYLFEIRYYYKVAFGHPFSISVLVCGCTRVRI